jgi:hypothetical protein
VLGWGYKASSRREHISNPPLAGFLLPRDKRKGSSMKDLREKARAWLRIISDDSFAISVLAAVIAVCILAFAFEADYHLIVVLLFLGAITAFAEARLRTKK